jgi:hypothetical protein
LICGPLGMSGMFLIAQRRDANREQRGFGPMTAVICVKHSEKQQPV